MDSLLRIVTKDTRYSQIVENEKVISDYGNVESISTEIFNLMAKGYLKIDTIHDDEEGDDFILNVTQLGKSKIERSKNSINKP